MTDNLDIWNRLGRTDPAHTKGCRVPGCERQHVAHGLCRTHYMRVWKNGTLELQNDAESFDSKYAVDPVTSCWNWQRGKDKDGYGKHTAGGRTVKAHRFSWERDHGPTPSGALLCHSCDNPSCVNPTHLFVGSHQDNHDDRSRKGRTARGERCGASKYPDHVVTAVQQPGWTEAKALAEFGMSRTHYYRIRRTGQRSVPNV